MPLHEDRVLEKHPKAKEFRPVKRAWSNDIYGWTFEFPADGSSLSSRYGWVTHDAEVSSDALMHRDRAAKNLRTYMRSRSTGEPFSHGPLTT